MFSLKMRPLFKRAGYYGYYDDEKRFIFFSYAIIEFIDLMKTRVDLIHLNDWQTALIPYLIDEIYRNKPKYKHIKTLLSIHNLEFQGSF